MAEEPEFHTVEPVDVSGWVYERLQWLTFLAGWTAARPGQRVDTAEVDRHYQEWRANVDPGHRAEIERLRAERDRYREALERIILTAPNLGAAAETAHKALDG